jgi:hypothetical protein
MHGKTEATDEARTEQPSLIAMKQIKRSACSGVKGGDEGKEQDSNF